MNTAIYRAGEWLHRKRRFFVPLLSIVAAASLAYSVEVLIIDGLHAWTSIIGLLVAGAVASSLLAVMMAFDVLAARRYGVVLHVALLRERSWRRRHEAEHELLVAEAKERSSLATTTALSEAETDKDAVERVAEMMLDSAATGAALLPGARDLRILAAGDITSLISLGYRIEPALKDWSTSLLVDRSHEEGEPFAELEIPQARPTDDGDSTLFVLVGDRLDDGPVQAYRAASGEPVRIVQRGYLKEEHREYESVLEEIAGKLPRGRRVTVAAGGPAVLGFAVGWLAASADVQELQALAYDGKTKRYLPGQTTRPSPCDAVLPRPSMGVGRRLFLASALLAAASTLAFGSFATLLEWGLAGSNKEGPFGDWLMLIGLGIALPSVLSYCVLNPWARRLARPVVRVALQPTDDTGSRRELLVAPRTPKDDAYSCVGWLMEAMADIRSFRPGSRTVIDLDSAPPSLPLESLGSYLNRGHRGGDVRLRCHGRDYTFAGQEGPRPVRTLRDRITPRRTPPQVPDRVGAVWSGYRDSLRHSRSWEVAR